MNMPVLVYDGDCGICEKSAEWLRKNAPHVLVKSNYEFGINELTSVLLVDRGSQYHGAEAINRVLRTSSTRTHVVMGAFLNAPIIRTVARIVYALIARHRSRISRMLGLTACAIKDQNAL
jgi:predicted DCC family thiol-disulfide oxidoreductase YuxK